VRGVITHTILATAARILATTSERKGRAQRAGLEPCSGKRGAVPGLRCQQTD
jgi:hypothetical protein